VFEVGVRVRVRVRVRLTCEGAASPRACAAMKRRAASCAAGQSR
jgi:hypothetical protein